MRIIKQWTRLGTWHKGPAAPNGSCFAGVERRPARFTLYAADFYGRGEHVYLRCEPMFQTCEDRCPRFMPGGWEDGNAERIAEHMQAQGIA